MNKKLSKILAVSSSAEDDFYFEPLLQILSHFTSLMEAYQAEEVSE